MDSTCVLVGPQVCFHNLWKCARVLSYQFSKLYKYACVLCLITMRLFFRSFFYFFYKINYTMYKNKHKHKNRKQQQKTTNSTKKKSLRNLEANSFFWGSYFIWSILCLFLFLAIEHSIYSTCFTLLQYKSKLLAGINFFLSTKVNKTFSIMIRKLITQCLPFENLWLVTKSSPETT